MQKRNNENIIYSNKQKYLSLKQKKVVSFRGWNVCFGEIWEEKQDFQICYIYFPFMQLKINKKTDIVYGCLFLRNVVTQNQMKSIKCFLK